MGLDKRDTDAGGVTMRKEKLKLFIGKYAASDESFICRARDKQDVLFLVDGTSGEPDMDSVRELNNTPFILDVIIDAVESDDGDGEMLEFKHSETGFIHQPEEDVVDVPWVEKWKAKQ
jgi:hypothetical protein